MKYKFSVIIPIYNVDKYLEETILSVINQSIGFENNIQIILVNDGSTDNSEEICKKYEKQYSKNIKYVYQENNGVSSARNKGIEYIQGEYVNFLDSDDVWDINVFEKVYNFFESHKNEIDIVACRQKFFEGKEGYHKLDYKFDTNRIVNIKEDYEDIQLSTSSAFIRADEVKKYKYDTRLKYSEDATLVGQILMSKSKYGILSDAIYNYRKRNENTSALQTREGNKSWYFDTIEYGYKTLIEKSIEKYGKVLPYFQYQIMYDIQWRINVDIALYLSEEEQKTYIKSIIELLKYIDDEIILNQKYLWNEYKILALCLKYQKDIREEFTYEDSKIYYNNTKVYNIKNNSLLKINYLNFNEKNGLILEGIINCPLLDKDYKIFIKTSDGNKIYLNNFITIQNRPSIIGNLGNCKEFKIKVPVTIENLEFKIMIDYKSNQRRLNLIFGQLAKLSNENSDLLYIKDMYLIRTEKNQIFIHKLDDKEIISEKKKYENYLNEINKKEMIQLRSKVRKRSFIKTYIKFENEDMYVIKTVKKWKDKFILSKKWKKVKENEDIKRLYILNSIIIVGQEKNVKEIFDEDEKYIKDLYKFRYVDGELK